MAVSSFGKWRTAILLGFRACVVGQLIAIFGQALLAGSALSGNSGSLAAHMTIGAVALVLSILQVVFGLFARDKLPGWALAASVGLLIGEMAQMASGRHHLYAIHLPLGVALFATMVPWVLWIANEAVRIDSTSLMQEDPAAKLSIGGE